jgi:hypothetical protein
MVNQMKIASASHSMGRLMHIACSDVSGPPMHVLGWLAYEMTCAGEVVVCMRVAWDRVQIVKVPEARKLMVMLAATATAEGVRGSLLGVRDVLLGQSCDSAATNGYSWLHLPQQQLYVLICIVFTVVLYLTASSRMETAFES